MKKIVKKVLGLILAAAIACPIMPAATAKAACNLDFTITYSDETTDTGKLSLNAPSTTAVARDIALIYPFIQLNTYLTEEEYQETLKLFDATVDDTHTIFIFGLDQTLAAVSGFDDGLYTGTVTLPVPEGYDASSCVVLAYGNDTRSYYRKDSAISYTDTTLTLPIEISADNGYYRSGSSSIPVVYTSSALAYQLKKKTALQDQTYLSSEGDSNYVVSDDKSGDVQVTYYKQETDSEVVTIPDTVTLSDGTVARVTSIDPNAFKGNTKIKKLVVGNNITSIPDVAFQNCKNLQNVTLGSGVKTIGTKAFAGCSNLKKVSFSNVEVIGDSAFLKCKKLKSLTLPATVTTVGTNAFKGCTKLVKLIINATSLKTIGKNAIKNISSNAKIVLKGSKSKKKAAAKMVSKKRTGYKNTMTIKK